jgi:hypothetical protein
MLSTDLSIHLFGQRFTLVRGAKATVELGSEKELPERLFYGLFSMLGMEYSECSRVLKKIRTSLGMSAGTIGRGEGRNQGISPPTGTG